MLGLPEAMDATMYMYVKKYNIYIYIFIHQIMVAYT